MTDRRESWKHGSAKWLQALVSALETYGEDDVVVPYAQVALAFPSSEPNPRSFESPLLDHTKLRVWASEHGWHVQPAPDIAAKQGDDPPVRFTKEAG